MTRSTWILLAALVVSLGLAYGASQKPSAPAAEVLESVWKVPTDQVTKVEVQLDQSHITLTVTPRKEGSGTYLWVDGQGLPGAPSPAERQQQRRNRKRGAPPPPPPAASQPVNDAFKGGPQAQRFVDEVANLQAIRVLGPSKGLNLADFGLGPDNKSYVSVERTGGAPLRIELGAVSVGGTARYALSSADGKVYLMRAGSLRSAANVRRFMDRELLPFAIQEAQRIDLQVGERKLSLYKLDVPNNQPNRWGRTPKDTAGDPALQDVVNSLLRIKAVHYLADAPSLEKATPALTATVTKGNDPPGIIRFYAEKGDEAPALSSYTQRPVALTGSLVKTLVEKARAVAKP